MRRIIASLLAFSYLLLFVAEIGAQSHNVRGADHQSSELLVESLSDGCQVPCCDCPSVNVQARIDKNVSYTLLHFEYLAASTLIIRDSAVPTKEKLTEAYLPQPNLLVKTNPIYLQTRTFLI